MSDYTPHNWQPGDSRTAARLTAMETGIDTLHSELAAHEALTNNPHADTPATVGATRARAGIANVWIQATAPTADAVNDVWGDTATGTIKYWDGSAWKRFKNRPQHWNGSEWRQCDLFYRNANGTWQPLSPWLEAFSDNFSRSDRPLAGDNGWETNWLTWQIVSSRARWTTPDVQTVWAHVFRPEDRSDVAAECVPKHELIGPIIRANSDGSQCTAGYTAIRAAGGTELVSIIGASARQILGTSGSAPNLSTDRLRVEAVGSTIRALLNDTEIIVVSDVLHSQGRSGIYVDSITGGSVRDADNFVESI